MRIASAKAGDMWPAEGRQLTGSCVLQLSWGEAAAKLAEVVNDDTFRSLEGKSKHQMWLELCDIITRHPDLVRGMKVDAILRSGIRKFTDEVSHHECTYTCIQPTTRFLSETLRCQPASRSPLRPLQVFHKCCSAVMHQIWR